MLHGLTMKTQHTTTIDGFSTLDPQSLVLNHSNSCSCSPIPNRKGTALCLTWHPNNNAFKKTQQFWKTKPWHLISWQKSCELLWCWIHSISCSPCRFHGSVTSSDRGEAIGRSSCSPVWDLPESPDALGSN